jgi:protein SDA1
MIELYKANIWNDEKTVNIIANGCFNDNHKIVLASCRFLIETTQNLQIDVDSSDDEENEKKLIADTAKKSIIKAKKLEKEMKKLKRKKKRK